MNELKFHQHQMHANYTGVEHPFLTAALTQYLLLLG